MKINEGGSGRKRATCGMLTTVVESRVKVDGSMLFLNLTSGLPRRRTKSALEGFSGTGGQGLTSSRIWVAPIGGIGGREKQVSSSLLVVGLGGVCLVRGKLGGGLYGVFLRRLNLLLKFFLPFKDCSVMGLLGWN